MSYWCKTCQIEFPNLGHCPNGCPSWAGNASYINKRINLIQYLKDRIEDSDWHAVSDAANDLRVLEAIHGRTYTGN